MSKTAWSSKDSLFFNSIKSEYIDIEINVIKKKII